MNSIAGVSGKLPAIRSISSRGRSWVAAEGKRGEGRRDERPQSDDSHVAEVNSDTRQLNHLLVHSVIDSLVEAPRRANCAWADRATDTFLRGAAFRVLFSPSLENFFFPLLLFHFISDSPARFARGRYKVAAIAISEKLRGSADFRRLEARRASARARREPRRRECSTRFAMRIPEGYPFAC